MNQLTVALAQIPITVTDKSKNIKTMEETAKNARNKNVELLIFPELALTGYVCRDLFYQLAEPLVALPSSYCREQLSRMVWQ